MRTKSARSFGVGSNADYKFDVFLLGEVLEPVEEFAEHDGVLVAYYLVEVIDKNVGDVIVAGMQAAEEALEEIVRAHRGCIVAGVDQACLIRDIVGEFFILFNAHDRTGFLADSRGDHFHQTFCFAGTFETHDQLDHMSITLLLKVRAAPCV